LFGFAMLVPALVFAVEMSTVRVQEIFVLYRSYLWMPCLAAILPILVRRVNRRLALAVLVLASGLLAAASVSRLKTLADPVAMWREALEHTLASETRNRFTVARVQHNLGQSYLNQRQFREALVHLNEAIRINPAESAPFNDRAVALLELKRYPEALQDYGQAIAIEPFEPLYFFGRAETHLAMGLFDEARNDYAYSCRLGKSEACAAQSSEKLGDATERSGN
jgi:tetratricopeptide (TPR) repeat protein